VPSRHDRYWREPDGRNRRQAVVGITKVGYLTRSSSRGKSDSL